MSNLVEKASIILTPTAYSDGTLHSIKPIQTFGSELVTNGDFATDSDWVKQTGWSISDGKAVSNGSNAYLIQSSIVSSSVNKIFKISFTVSDYVSGSWNVGVGGYDFYQTSSFSDGDYTVYAKVLNVSANNNFYFRGFNLYASIDNVSVKEVIDADFDFTRSTTAIRLNSSGNIESVAANLPRIDYLGGTGHILLEPQSTNTATYSNDFTQGDIFNSSSDPALTGAILNSQQATSPDGTNNAWLLKDNNGGGSGVVALRYPSTNVTSNHFNTLSIFVKKALSNDFIILKSGAFDSSGNGSTWFNVNNGTLGDISSNHTAKIEDYGNGYYRCSITFKTVTDVSGPVQLQLASTNGSDQVTKDGTNGVYIFGLQCEADASQNFATSYIPTSGSAVTRNADEANNSGSSDLINSTEGVIYAEISSLANDGTSRRISLSDGGSSDRLEIFYGAIANRIDYHIYSGSSFQASGFSLLSSATDFNKIAVKYKENDFALWVNGTEASTDTSGSSPIGLNKLQLQDASGSNDFYGKVKSVAVFKEALTDAQLIALTS